MIDREAVVFQNIFHDLYGLAVNLLRLQGVQLLRYSIDLSKTVSAAKDLMPEKLLILQGVLIELLRKLKPLPQQVVFILYKARGFRIAQLHISAGSTYYEINKERQPVGRLVKQQYKRHSLPKVSKNQRKRREKSCKHTGVQAVYSADKHYESQPEINHLELRVCVGKLYQKFRDPRCQQDLEKAQQPDLIAQSIDYPVEQRLFRRLAFLPCMIDLRQVVQQTIALKPPISVAYHLVVCRIRLERIGTVGHFQCRA